MWSRRLRWHGRATRHGADSSCVEMRRHRSRWTRRIVSARSSRPRRGSVSRWASTAYAGTALTTDAIKLSARQVLEIPLPVDGANWDLAAGALAGGDLLAAGELMTIAYGCGEDVTRWWANRWQRS